MKLFEDVSSKPCTGTSAGPIRFVYLHQAKGNTGADMHSLKAKRKQKLFCKQKGSVREGGGGGGKCPHGGGDAPAAELRHMAASVALIRRCISSISFFISLSRLNVFPLLAFSASAASFSRCKDKKKQKNTAKNVCQV